MRDPSAPRLTWAGVEMAASSSPCRFPTGNLNPDFDGQTGWVPAKGSLAVVPSNALNGIYRIPGSFDLDDKNLGSGPPHAHKLTVNGRLSPPPASAAGAFGFGY
jgi:hypothetical protein